MRSHVAQLLKRPVPSRKMLSVSLDAEQAEMVEKLSLFFTKETNHNFSKNQVIEEAVRAFVDESADYIAEEYDLDIRGTPLTDLQQHKRVFTIDIAALDTIVLPVRDDEESRGQVFRQQHWNALQLDPEKLQNIKYVAFYFGSPTSAITHYARILSFAPAPEDPRKHIPHFDAPEELSGRLEWREARRARLRRPRYTVFAMLLEAKCIDELFAQ